MPEYTFELWDDPPQTYDADGYDRDGYDRDGYDRDGYDRNGYDRNGYDRYGYDRYGYDRYGYDPEGYDRDGYDRDGYRANGYNRDGYNRDGYDRDGYNRDGYDRDGYDWDGYDREGYDREGYNREGYNRDGNTDDDYDDDYDSYDGYDNGYRGSSRSNDYVQLHSYDYTPRLEFMGTGPAFYGMEIEITSDNSQEILQKIDREAGHCTWLKHDGSVSGFEWVTHPMSYEWAMENFPWTLLPELRALGCRVIARDNGIHVHVSRDGFSNASHLYRWMKFLYRNQQHCERVARRSHSGWGDFDTRGRNGQLQHVMNEAKKKRGVPVYHWDETRHNRYSAINTQNENTLEVRIFASTLSPAKAKSALQLIAGSVEYTRQLTAHDICREDAWSWGAFACWLQGDGRYPELAATEITYGETWLTARDKTQKEVN